MVDPFDLGSLFGSRAILEGLDPGGTPAMVVLGPVDDVRSVALLPGSFDPPTAAHVLLAERARADGWDEVVLVLARATAGKDRTGLMLEDRVLALRSCGNGFRIGLTSHGLYAEQAAAASAVFPNADLSFLVGSDKVFQIFDDRWYADRDAALERLFARARLVVAPRADHSEQLRDILSDPRNVRWSDRVEVLRLHPAVNDLSSTRVRGLLRSGADPAGLVPPPVAALLQQVRAFAPPRVLGAEEVDSYALRASLVDALWGCGFEPAAADLRGLQRFAEEDSAEARSFRALLRDRAATPQDLAFARARAEALR